MEASVQNEEEQILQSHWLWPEKPLLGMFVWCVTYKNYSLWFARWGFKAHRANPHVLSSCVWTVIFLENNSAEKWMAVAWFWCLSNWPICFFVFSTSHLFLFSFQLCPFFSWELTSRMPKHYSLWPAGNGPFYISRLPSHRLKIMESLLLPVPSRSVFLGILWKTLGVDPGMTPCPVPSLWGTSQLGIKPVLAVSRILVVFETGKPCRLEETAVLGSQGRATQHPREKGDKRHAATLHRQQLFFVRFKIYSVKNYATVCGAKVIFTHDRMASSLK